MEKNGLRDPMRRPPPYTRATASLVFGPQCKLCTANPIAGLNPGQRVLGAVIPYGPLPSDML